MIDQDYQHESRPQLRKLSRKQLKRQGVYILPSLLTSLGLMSGFYSIIYSVNAVHEGWSDFSPAAFAIFVAAFLDGLDGRIARLMKAESEFGFQFDSIADIVSFGVAPAVLIYTSALQPLGRFGWLAAFVFVACAGIRLARFNVISQNEGSKKYFKGLSSPVAAGGIALTAFWASPFSEPATSVVLLSLTIVLAFLMVSNVRFRSFKQIDTAKARPIRTFLLILLLVVFAFSWPRITLGVMFIVYVSWGLIEELLLFRRRRRSDPTVPFVPFGERDDTSEEDSFV